MALTAANPGGWSLNEVLTSAQMNHLQNELLKAVDGVGGGTYLLGASLEFQGADVRFESEIEVLSGSELNLNPGSILNVFDGVTGTINGDLTFGPNSDTVMQANAVQTFEASSLLDIEGQLRVPSGGVVNVNTGGRVDLNNGSEMHVEGTATLDIEGSGGLNVTTGGFLRIRTSGDLRVESGGDVVFESGGSMIVQSGGDVTLQAGAVQTVEDAEDIVINDSPEIFRLTLTPAFHDNLNPWARTSDASGLLGWYQTDVAARRSIWFALPIPPGDDLVDLFVTVDGDAMGAGHGGVLPTQVATVEIVAVDQATGAVSVVASRDDQEPGATYDDVHDIVLANGSLDSGTLPRTSNFAALYVRVRGEFGGTATLGLTILQISGTCIARSYRNGNAFR